MFNARVIAALMPGPFVHHLLEAMRLNRRRAPDYARASGGRSAALSRRLIATEAALLPWAWIFDLLGGSALSEAFVGMEGVAPWETPSRLTGAGADAEALAAAQEIFAELNRSAFAPPAAALEPLSTAIARLRALEIEYQRHLAMSIHLAESLARAAAVARGRPVFRALLLFQWAGVWLAPGLDARAWPAQSAGVGVLVNDLPAIPWRARA